MIGQNVLGAELLLAKYFTENTKEWIPVSDIMHSIKSQHLGINRAEIKEARQRLGITSQHIDGEYQWKWNNEKSPKTVWGEKSKELFGG